jgi:hypothetical protein
MMHLIILILVVLLAWQTIILVGRVIWLAVLIVAWCVMAGVTVVLGLAIGVQWLMQLVAGKYCRQTVRRTSAALIAILSIGTKRMVFLQNNFDGVGAAAAFRRAAQRGIDIAHPRTGC